MSRRVRRPKSNNAEPTPTPLRAADLDKEFAQLENLLRVEEVSEETQLRAEKRYLQYEVILRPMVQTMGFQNTSSIEALRRYKKQLYRAKKYERRGPAGGEVKHCCQTRGGGEQPPPCRFQSLRKGERHCDPLDARIKFEASGSVYVCVDTLVAHICGLARCKRYIVQTQGILVCDISGLVMGTQMSIAAPGHWVRPGTGVTDGGEGGEYDLGGGGAGADEGEGAGDDDDWQPAAEENDTFASMTSKKRRKIPQQQEETTTKKLLLPPPPPAPAPPPPPPTARLTTVNSFQSAYFSSTAAAAAASKKGEPTHRFARGSVAHVMAVQVAGGGMSAKAWYGTDLIRFSFASTKPASREHARQISYAMLYNARAKAIFEEKHRVVLRAAERDADYYYEMCTLQQRVPDRFMVYGLYWQHIEPLFVASVSRVISEFTDADSEAHGYLCDAILRVWKLCEASPYCCEENLSRGGPAAKKKHTHTHIKRIAPAILYHLRGGICSPVYYDRETRRVFDDEKEAQKHAATARIEHEDVEFIPAHRYLLTRLPSEEKIKRLDFSQVQGNGTVGLSIIENMCWMNNCYRSLTTVQPPLSIEQVREYCLARYLTIFDEPEEQDGRFVKADDPSFVPPLPALNDALQ